MASNLIPNCDMQMRLKELFTCDLMSNYSTQVPLMQAFNSPAFSNRLNASLLTKTGQTLTIKGVWEKSDPISIVDEGCETSLCTGGDAPAGQDSETYTLGDCDYSLKAKKVFTIEDYRAMVQLADNPSSLSAPIQISPNGNAFEREVWKMQEQLEIAAEAKLATQLPGLVNGTTYGFSANEGLFAPTSPASTDYGKVVKTFGAVPAGFNVKGDLASEVAFSAMQVGYCSNPLVIGGKPVWEYMKQMDSGCCASNGIDIGDYYAKHPVSFLFSNQLAKEFTTLYEDDLEETETGVNNPYFLSIEQGAVQILNYYKFANGIFNLDFETHKKFTYRSAVTGAWIDMSVYVDTCGGKVIVSLQLNQKLVALPDQFLATDHRSGANGIQQFKIKNA